MHVITGHIHDQLLKLYSLYLREKSLQYCKTVLMRKNNNTMCTFKILSGRTCWHL